MNVTNRDQIAAAGALVGLGVWALRAVVSVSSVPALLGLVASELLAFA